MDGLTDKDNQILTKVDGNTKKIGKLGSEFVSFSRSFYLYLISTSTFSLFISYNRLNFNLIWLLLRAMFPIFNRKLLNYLRQRVPWNLFKRVSKVKTSCICVRLFHKICVFLVCPSGWSDGGKLGCYYAAKEASRMSYASAQNYCKSLDGRAHLVEIRTQEIQTFVRGLKDLQSHTYWWLGGSDQAKVWRISYW